MHSAIYEALAVVSKKIILRIFLTDFCECALGKDWICNRALIGL